VALRGREGLRVPRVGVPRHADAGVVGEHALEPAAGGGRAVGDAHLSGVQRVADSDTAPEAVLSKALRIAQSAMASEPSRMPSVSRNGEATDPVSRWSRPITMGADTWPSATRSFSATPNRARSPCPSQQMRAGSPWNATRSRARVIQRRKCASSGNCSRTSRSVRYRSWGSPESATHRNGPLPSQNRGRMYSGTKPGISKASATPASRASVRMLLP